MQRAANGLDAPRPPPLTTIRTVNQPAGGTSNGRRGLDSGTDGSFSDDASSTNFPTGGTATSERRASVASAITASDLSEHDELQATIEAKNFRAEVSKHIFHHVQYVTEEMSMKLDSCFGGYVYQMYLLEMTGGDSALLKHYKQRWDGNTREVGPAIKKRRGAAIQAIRKGYVEWDSLLKQEKGEDACVPHSDVLWEAWKDDEWLFADIIEHLVLPARGKPEKSGYSNIANMEDFDSVNFTTSLIVFVLHTVKDKEAVWREQIETGERSKTTTAKPLYTVSGRFCVRGMGFDNRKTGEESGLEVRNRMMEEFEDQCEDLSRYSVVLAAVKARFEEKRQKELEGRKAKELETAARKRRGPPTVRFGKVSEAKQRKLAALLGDTPGFRLDEVGETQSV